MPIRLTQQLLLSLCALSVLSAESKTFVEVNGVVSMECENATSISGWVADTGYPSSGVTMRDEGVRNKDNCTFDITFSRTGRYFVWFRMRKPDGATDGSNDSIVKVDGQSLKVWDGTTEHNVIGMGTHQKELRFQSRPKTNDDALRGYHPYFDVSSAGPVQFILFSRSPGFLVDKIVLIHADEGGDDNDPAVLGGKASFGPPETDGNGGGNQAPSVDAGADQTVILGASVALDGTVSDDGQPGGSVTTSWSGAGASFADASAVDTTASFAAVGTYTLTLTADDGELSGSDSVVITVLPEPVAGAVKINFQPAASEVPLGYLVDDGAAFGDRGNGHAYGWVGSANDMTRERNADSDQRIDTLNHFENGSVRSWQIALANGSYDLVLHCGDPKYTDSTNSLVVEGVTVTDPDGADNADQYVLSVTVADGTLDITQAASGNNAKIAYIDIVPANGGGGRAVTLTVTPLPSGIWSVELNDGSDSDVLDDDGVVFSGLDVTASHDFSFVEQPAAGG